MVELFHENINGFYFYASAFAWCGDFRTYFRQRQGTIGDWAIANKFCAYSYCHVGIFKEQIL